MKQKRETAGRPAGREAELEAENAGLKAEVRELRAMMGLSLEALALARIFDRLPPEDQQLLLQFARRLSGLTEDAEVEDPPVLVGL